MEEKEKKKEKKKGDKKEEEGNRKSWAQNNKNEGFFGTFSVIAQNALWNSRAQSIKASEQLKQLNWKQHQKQKYLFHILLMVLIKQRALYLIYSSSFLGRRKDSQTIFVFS